MINQNLLDTLECRHSVLTRSLRSVCGSERRTEFRLCSELGLGAPEGGPVGGALGGPLLGGTELGGPERGGPKLGGPGVGGPETGGPMLGGPAGGGGPEGGVARGPLVFLCIGLGWKIFEMIEPTN